MECPSPAAEIRYSSCRREAAIRAIQASGVKVRSITDLTPIPH
ncbi:MAG: 30S ribosomal protein S11, partial [Chloroflexota bacterium]